MPPKRSKLKKQSYLAMCAKRDAGRKEIWNEADHDEKVLLAKDWNWKYTPAKPLQAKTVEVKAPTPLEVIDAAILTACKERLALTAKLQELEAQLTTLYADRCRHLLPS